MKFVDNMNNLFLSIFLFVIYCVPLPILNGFPSQKPKLQTSSNRLISKNYL